MTIGKQIELLWFQRYRVCVCVHCNNEIANRIKPTDEMSTDNADPLSTGSFYDRLSFGRCVKCAHAIGYGR